MSGPPRLLHTGAMHVGLGGVGKTIMLKGVRPDAEEAGIHNIRIEAPEGRSLLVLPALPTPQLRQALLRLSQTAAAKNVAVRRLQRLPALQKLKVTFSDIEVGFNYDPEPGFADNGDLEHYLHALFEQVGIAVGPRARHWRSSSTSSITARRHNSPPSSPGFILRNSVSCQCCWSARACCNPFSTANPKSHVGRMFDSYPGSARCPCRPLNRR